MRPTPTAALLAGARLFNERLRHHFGEDLLQVRLFGSAARGEANEASDADVFVLLRRARWAEKKIVLNLAGDVWYETGVFVSPLVLGESEFENARRQDRPLVRNVLCEGMPL